MDKIELEIKNDKNTKNDFAGKLELVSNTNMVTKEEHLQKFVAKVVIKNRTIIVASQMFIDYEKDLDETDKIIKRYEDYIGDNKIRNDILGKVCGDNVKEICT